jgi:hypothetical protein
MTFKVAIYHKTVPNKKNLEKTQMLEFFGTGVNHHGDIVINVHDRSLVEADVGVIQGWITADTQRPHLQLRNDVITQQISKHRYVLTADSNLFLYANPANPLHYLRYSFNGVFPNTGIYFDTTVDPSRWIKISQDLGISIKDYRTKGNHILLCLQRNGGWSMGEYSVVAWAKTVMEKLRQYTDRPFILRPHPGDQQSKIYLQELLKVKHRLNFTFSVNADIKDDLKNCWAVVNHNSSPGVVAAIEGVPVFVTDPDRSQCRDIANLELSQIERPTLHDRTNWINRLAMSHWKFSELQSGEAWAHMRPFVRDTL